MTGEGYEVLFDISREPFNEWIWSTPAFVMVLLGALLIRFGAWRETRLCGWLFSVVFAACGLGALLILWHDYSRLRRAYVTNDYEIVEGRVEGFRPDSASGKDPQVFWIGDQTFSMSRTTISAGFRETVSAGGPHLENRCARIAYTADGEILWLGVRAAGC